MEINPWKVDSLEAFACLKCPECTYFSREEINFKNHAIDSHPLSSIFFEQLESQVVIASEENDTLDKISGKELSKHKQFIPTAFYRSEISDTFVTCENMVDTVNTCAIIRSDQNEELVLSFDNFDHSDKLSTQETKTNQSVSDNSDRLPHDGKSLEVEILPLHYPEVSLTEGTEPFFHKQKKPIPNCKSTMKIQEQEESNDTTFMDQTSSNSSFSIAIGKEEFENSFAIGEEKLPQIQNLNKHSNSKSIEKSGLSKDKTSPIRNFIEFAEPSGTTKIQRYDQKAEDYLLNNINEPLTKKRKTFKSSK